MYAFVGSVRWVWSFAFCASLCLCDGANLNRPAPAGELRVGIIGCDTSHATAFTELLNNPSAKGHVPGAKVVAAFKGGSSDIPSSASRVEEYARALREKYGVRFYDTIEEMCGAVDAVLLLSVDGRPHLAQLKPVLAARKPVFVDKPMAASLADVLEMFRLAKKAKTPIFSASALRFQKDTQAARDGAVGRVSHAESTGPCEIETHHPDLFWYGVHGTETLFTVLGPGCQTVERRTTSDGKIEVTGVWKGNRTGIYREDKQFGGRVRGAKGERPVGSFDGYGGLVTQIVSFFKTGISPVPERETVEIFAFMEAADASKAAAGKPVALKAMLKRAKK